MLIVFPDIRVKIRLGLPQTILKCVYCSATNIRSHSSHVRMVSSRTNRYQSVVELEYRVAILQLEVHGFARYIIV